MILLDYNQIVLANFFVSIGNHHNIDVDEGIIRHMILNSIRALNKKFKKEYGEMVICADGRRPWRKDFFSYYKASRKKSREESEIDWDAVFKVMNTVREELKEYFDYKVLHFEDLEADDCIGILAHHYGTVLNVDTAEPILIVSSDKDYIQLQTYANVDQYDNIRSRWITHSDPSQYLAEHIFKGDAGDGVPNILSQDNIFMIDGLRQKPMTKKRMAQYSGDNPDMEPDVKRYYERNKLMIDLSQIPDEYKERVVNFYENYEHKGRSDLFNYFVKNKLKLLMTDIGDF